MKGVLVAHAPREAYSASSSVGSSSSDSSRGTCRKTRFRTVHLKRSNGCPTFGFSFRGGREFGTGFFVSVVEPGSEAHAKGVKVGDQIVRINGLTVENATHQEVLQLAQHHHHLTLSLKNVGLIPVKDKSEDPLTWRLVEQPLDSTLLAGSSDIDRVLIEFPEGAKLGCGICKGPDWRPGIFVQYTKPASLARQAGLQPGDQILQCNRVSFTNIDFTYAVAVLKTHGALDLIIRKGSGIDLFPGESSGYSSASSTTDEPIHRPNFSNYKETNGQLTTNQPVGGCRSNRCDSKQAQNSEEKNRIPPPPPPMKNTDCSKRDSSPIVTLRQECRYGSQTVVQITSGSCPVQVEVHQQPASLSSVDNTSGSTSISSENSFASAISQEFQRRKERKTQNGDAQVKERPARKPLEGQSKDHDLLIAELKRRQDNRMAAYRQEPESPPDSLDSPPDCPTPDYSDASGSPLPSLNVKSSILRFEERSKKPKCVTFGGSTTKEITPNKSDASGEHRTEEKTTCEDDTVEMHSMDNVEFEGKKQAPKPPSTYFKPAPRKDLSDSPKRTTVIKITESESFDSELAKTLSRLKKDGVFKKVEKTNCVNNCKEFVPSITQDVLSNVKKTLKTFEKNSAANTIIVQIPKRT